MGTNHIVTINSRSTGGTLKFIGNGFRFFHFFHHFLNLWLFRKIFHHCRWCCFFYLIFLFACFYFLTNEAYPSNYDCQKQHCTNRHLRNQSTSFSTSSFHNHTLSATFSSSKVLFIIYLIIICSHGNPLVT